MPEKYISEVILNNFRNYSNRTFDFCGGFNILVGPNGRGKTSLLEAISLVSDARGLRGAQVDEMVSMNCKRGGTLPDDVMFSVYLKFNDRDRVVLRQKYDRKLIKFNDEQLRNTDPLTKILRITYFIPQMDQFFMEDRPARVKFLDRTADMLFVSHYANVKKYEFFLRERIKILLTNANQNRWLDIVEKKIAELGTAIADVRNRIISRLNQIFLEYTTEFPMEHLNILGEVENGFSDRRALEIENFYRRTLFSNRDIDRETKKTNFGVHRSDLSVSNRVNGVKAELCSSGEQKMLLLSLIVTRAIFSKQINSGATVLLLDEACSHIDETAREKLFFELGKLDIQSFITGTDPGYFKNLEKFANSKIIEL
ncbi:MAG: AAA family ATPase [Rickettsiales bacterium]|jgi:DNA replication and repair protein RecF|nr:AAA family ATPase [Rickettsiales bacterium]